MPEMGADKKNLGSSPRRRGGPFLAYINPSHKRIFSFMNLQEGFKEIKREQVTNASPGTGRRLDLWRQMKIL